MKFILPPILLAIGTILLSSGLWFIYKPLTPIFIGIALIAVAVGLGTSSEIKK